MTHLIVLFRHNHMWMIKDSDPKTVQKYGVDTLYTEFTDRTPPLDALRLIKNLYRDKAVLLRYERIQHIESI